MQTHWKLQYCTYIDTALKLSKQCTFSATQLTGLFCYAIATNNKWRKLCSILFAISNVLIQDAGRISSIIRKNTRYHTCQIYLLQVLNYHRNWALNPQQSTYINRKIQITESSWWWRWVRFNVPPNTLQIISGKGLYGSNDSTNSVKALKEDRVQSHQVHPTMLQ